VSGRGKKGHPNTGTSSRRGVVVGASGVLVAVAVAVVLVLVAVHPGGPIEDHLQVRGTAFEIHSRGLYLFHNLCDRVCLGMCLRRPLLPFNRPHRAPLLVVVVKGEENLFIDAEARISWGQFLPSLLLIRLLLNNLVRVPRIGRHFQGVHKGMEALEEVECTTHAEAFTGNQCACDWQA